MTHFRRSAELFIWTMYENKYGTQYAELKKKNVWRSRSLGPADDAESSHAPTGQRTKSTKIFHDFTLV